MTSATSRGLLFGTTAESYERFRLGYPDEVVDRTLAYADRGVREAVEVGAGTGKATRAFASRGIQVTALEPDPDMFGVLQRETIGMPVTPVMLGLESYAGSPVDLVYAASSWHWTDPATRWSRTVATLKEDGVLAIFGSTVSLVDPEAAAAVGEAQAGWLDEDRPPGLPEGGWHDEVVGTGLFCDVQEQLLPREVVLPQREFVGYLSTVPAYLRLAPDDRQSALRQVAAALPAQVRIDRAARMLLARRAF